MGAGELGNRQHGGAAWCWKWQEGRVHPVHCIRSTGKGFSTPALLRDAADLTCSHPHPCCRHRSRISSLQPAAAGAPSLSSPPASFPEDSSSRKGEERKGCNDNPQPFHLISPQIYQPAQLSASLPLSLAHNQMITQGFAEKRHEASPLPIWEGALHYTQEEMHLFPAVAWGRKSS